MGRREIIRTTLGDLIAAVTDEVTAFMGDSPAAYIVVSYVMSDLLTRHRVRAPKRSRRAVFGNG
jgi:hypothetical protein